MTMEKPLDNSGPNRPTAPGGRLWYFLGAGGLLLVIIGGLVAWSSLHRQVQAIAEIERLGGWIEGERVGPDWLREIVGDEVMLVDDNVNVSLSNTSITDAGLVHLSELTNLQELWLDGTQVTDAGLVQIKGQTTLLGLYLSNTQVTDAGLVHLKRLTNLNSLALSGTQVTDAGLVHLKGLANLHVLWIADTHVTDGAVKDLQTALPGCLILQ